MSREPARAADVVRRDAWMRHHSTSFTVQMVMWVGILIVVCACGVVVMLPGGSSGAVVVGGVMLAVGFGCLLLAVRYLLARVRVKATGVEIRNAWRKRTLPLDQVSHFQPHTSVGLPARTGGGSCDSVALVLANGRRIGLSAFEHSRSKKDRDPPFYAEVAAALTELLSEVRAR